MGGRYYPLRVDQVAGTFLKIRISRYEVNLPGKGIGFCWFATDNSLVARMPFKTDEIEDYLKDCKPV